MQYVRARYLDVQAGRWVSRDPIGYDGGDWNLFRYVGNEPISMFDQNGLRPRSGIPIIPCPKAVGEAKDKLCKALRKLGLNGIVNSKCCTGPKQALCLLNWCNDNKGNIYCVDPKSAVCKSACAFTLIPPGGGQNPDINSYLCWPTAISYGCDYHNKCKNLIAETILHERMHACGTGETGGFPDPDPAENRAQCLCPLLGL